jgi:hypothetical protein
MNRATRVVALLWQQLRLPIFERCIMKTTLLVTAILAVGVVSANAGIDERPASLLYKRNLLDSAVMSVHVAPASGAIDRRSSSSLYMQNLRDSGYDAKNNFDKAGKNVRGLWSLRDLWL